MAAVMIDQFAGMVIANRQQRHAAQQNSEMTDTLRSKIHAGIRLKHSKTSA